MKHAGKLLDGVGDRVVGDVTTICKWHGVFSQWQITTRIRAVNRMQGRVLEVVQEPAQQTTLLSLAVEHRAMSTKIDLMQLVRTISFPSSSSLCTIVQQLETFLAQQATLQASINALQPLVLATEKLSTRLESFESATANALANLDDLLVEIAANLNDIKHLRDIERDTNTNTSKRRLSSILPPPSPEFPPFKRRKFDLTPSSPEVIPSSQPNGVDENDSVDEHTSPTVPATPSSNALPLICPTPFTPTQAEYKLSSAVSPVPTPCPLEKQKAKPAQSRSPRSLKSTNIMVNSLQGSSITEHSRALFPTPPQMPPDRAVDDHKTTPYQVGISPTVLDNSRWIYYRPTSQIPNLSPRQPPLFASVESLNTVRPIPSTATLAFQSPIIPPYVQTNLKPKSTRRTIKLDSDGEESQSGIMGQTCINMLAEL